MNHPIKVLLPWNTSNFMPLNAFHPIYRFIIEAHNEIISPPIRYFTFNERLLVEFLLVTQGIALKEYMKEISKRLGRDSQKHTEFKEIWNFFDIDETLAGELSGADLQVLHTTPLSVGIKPFIFHLESFETLFYPWAISDPLLASTPEIKIKSIIEYIKGLLENPKCLRIVSHLPSTLVKFKTVFQSDLIQKKLVHCPLGFPLLQKNPSMKNHYRFIYTSSLHKNLSNLERIGIRIVFQFMKCWLEKFPEDEFVLFIPPIEENDFPDLDFEKIFSHPNVYNFGNQYVSGSEFKNILCSSDFMLIPSYQLHSASILNSMGAGVIPVVSDLGTVNELGISPKNSIILDIFSKLDQTESPIFGGIPSLQDFNTQYMTIAGEMVNRLETFKKNPEKKTTLSINAQSLIRERYGLQSASRQFCNIIHESIRDHSERLTLSTKSLNSEKPPSPPFFQENLFGPPENLIPLRPIVPADFDTLPLYRSFLNLGFVQIFSNGQRFLINNYNHSKLRGSPSVLSNNNGRTSFMGDWEQNFAEAMAGGESDSKRKYRYLVKSFLNKYPRLKRYLKKIGIHKIVRKTGLI